MSEYGDMCRDIRTARREARAKHGINCPRVRASAAKGLPVNLAAAAALQDSWLPRSETAHGRHRVFDFD